MAVQERALLPGHGEGGVPDPGAPLAGAHRQAVQDGEAQPQQEPLHLSSGAGGGSGKSCEVRWNEIFK